MNPIGGTNPGFLRWVRAKAEAGIGDGDGDESRRSADSEGKA